MLSPNSDLIKSINLNETIVIPEFLNPLIVWPEHTPPMHWYTSIVLNPISTPKKFLALVLLNWVGSSRSTLNLSYAILLPTPWGISKNLSSGMDRLVIR